MAQVHYEKHGHIVVITMEGDTDLNIGMVGGVHEPLLDYRDDDDLWCAVITGAGERAFSAGGDLRRFRPVPGEARLNSPGSSTRNPPSPTVLSDLELWKPLIAAVNGYCIGAGMMLALACDIRIASESAEFGIPEAKNLGVPAGGGVAWRLPRTIALGPALEILLTGDRIGAQQALQWGLVNQVVPQGELMDAAMKLAERVAANPPLATRATKELVYRALDLPLSQAVRLKDALASSRICNDTEDAREARHAFAEKRKPEFKGR